MKKTQSTFVLVFVLALAGSAVAQRPTITDFNPKIGAENTVVTITGTGFNQSTANNVVLFGTKRATVLTSTTTQLTVAVPRGAMYEPLTVTNLSSGLVGYATLPFRPTVRTRDSITTFSSTSLSIGAGRLVTAGDFNTDTNPDLSVSVPRIGSVDLVRTYQHASSSDTILFSQTLNEGIGTNVGPYSIEHGDFNGDGRHDIVSLGQTTANRVITLLRNNSAATVVFDSVARYTTNNQIGADLAIGDLNRDGKVDIVVAVDNVAYVLAYRNTSTSTISYAAGVQLAGGLAHNSVAIGDVDRDGVHDLVVSYTDSNRVAVFRMIEGTALSFSYRRSFPVTTSQVPQEVRLGDYDADGDLDIAVSTSVGATKSITILSNFSTSGNVSFGSPVSFTLPTTSEVNSIAFGDLNGDGRPDIAAASQSSPNGSVVLLENRTTAQHSPSFVARGPYFVGPNPYNLAIVDLNNDGLPEIAVAGGGYEEPTTQLRVLRNTTSKPTSLFSVNRTSVSFTTPINTTRVDSVIVTNTGGDTLRISSASVGTTKFQVVPASATVAPGASRSFRITFIPLADTSLVRDSVTFLHNAPSTRDIVALSGRGTAPVYSVNRTSITFATPVGTPRADSVIVTNTGTDTLRITSAALGNTRYQVTPTSAAVAPGGARTFRITFTPTDTTLQRDTLRLTHNATGSPSRVFLSGRGTAPAFNINRTTIAFTTPINTARTDSAMVSNVGNDTLRITSASLGNPRFQVTPNAATIAPGSTRAFRITFSPGSDTTLQRDTLRLLHNAAGSPSRVFLSGRGTAPVYTVNRTALTFTIPVNTARTDSVIVTNTGTDTLRMTSASVSNPRFQATPSVATIAPGASRTFRVTFTPGNDTTLQRDTLRFSHNANGSPSRVFLTGRGIAPALSLNRTSLSFITQVNTAQTDSIIVGNPGSDTLRITFAGVGNPHFQVTPQTATISPSGSRAFRITFSPFADTTLQRDTLRFVHNTAGSPTLVFLSGRGTPLPVAIFSLDRTSLTFNTLVNTVGTDSVRVTNLGSDTLRIVSAAASNFRFQVFPQIATLAPGATRAFRVTFSPQQDTTLQRDTLRFQHNASGSPHLVALSGRGLAPQFLVNRTLLTFNIPVNTSRTDSVFVSNVGSDTLRITSAFVRNPRFAVAPQAAVLLPARQQVFRVTFTPQSDTTLQRDSLTFVHNGFGSPAIVTLSGKANPTSTAIVTINRTALTFNVPVNSSRTDSVVVSNIGTDTLRILSAIVANPRFQSTPSSATVAPGAGRAFRVTFSPQSDTSLQRDTLRIAHNAEGSPLLVALEGRGIPPSLPFFQADSATISFGRVVVNTFRDYSISIFNPGTGALRIDSVRSTSPAFRLTVADTATILPSQSRQFTVRFTPSRVGAENRIIRFYHNAPSRSDAIGLSGTGVLPAPTDLRVTDSTSAIGVIRLQWGPIPISEGFLHYRVYGGTTQNPTAVIDSTANARRDSVTTTLSNLVVGTRYYFRITAMDSFRNESAYSNEAAATVFIRAPEVLTGTGAFDTLSGRAIMRGRVNPLGATTVAWFEYDTIPLPSNSASTTPPRQLGNGITQLLLEDTTSVLLRGRQYYFRLVAQNSFSVSSFGAVQTLLVPPGAVVPPLPPALRVPPDNANVVSSVQMTWERSAGASSYHLQVALDTNFSATTFYLINDSTLTDSSRILQPLAAATVYYWRVGAKNLATQSAIFSAPRRFETERSRDIQSPLLVFPPNPRSVGDYRLVSIPGNGATLADLIAGAGPTEGVDWRIFRDNGRGDTVGRQHLVPLVNPSTILTQGEGYWLIRKHALTIRRNAPMTPLDRDGAVPIPLHDGFNIIGNPFELPVSWNAVRAKNPDLTNARLYHYTGLGYDTSAVLEPFGAYYMFKPPALTALRVPYPFVRTNPSSPSVPKDWQVQIEYRSGESEDKLNFIGISPAAADALDALEHYEAPLTFNNGSLYFVRPEWDRAHALFSDDFRPSLGEGQTWEFEVANPKLAHGVIEVRGLESVPAGYRVLLINRMNTVPQDLRAAPRYEFVPTSEKTQFTLVVGTPNYAAGIAAKFIPVQFALMQNYPNPFNPTTTISYAVAREAHVRIEIVSALGAHVRTLVNQVQQPASYTLQWDATSDDGAAVATGVYFYRFIAAGNIVGTRKMVLLR